MSEMSDLMARIGAGEIDVNAAIPEFLGLLKTVDEDRPPGKLTFLQSEERAEAGLPDATNTFTQVTSAWIGDVITDEQYQVLHRAAQAGVRTEDPSQVETEAPEADDADAEIEDPDA